MNDVPTQHLTRDQILALKFAAHRQLARWAKTRQLQPPQRARRAALVHAVRILEHHAYAHGCELRATSND